MGWQVALLFLGAGEPEGMGFDVVTDTRWDEHIYLEVPPRSRWFRLAGRYFEAPKRAPARPCAR